MGVARRVLDSNSSKRTLGSQEVSLVQKEKSECPSVGFMTHKDANHTLVLAGPPRREKLSHRPSHTIVHALSKFELHWWLRCVRVWGMLAALCTGVGDVGPKLDTYMPDRGAREVLFYSFLDQLSRKLDGSRTIKIC